MDKDIPAHLRGIMIPLRLNREEVVDAVKHLEDRTTSHIVDKALFDWLELFEYARYYGCVKLECSRCHKDLIAVPQVYEKEGEMAEYTRWRIQPCTCVDPYEQEEFALDT